MADIVENNSAKNASLYKSLARDERNERLAAGLDLSAYNKRVGADSPDYKDVSVGIGLGFRLENGKFKFGFASPTDISSELRGKAIDANSRAIMYDKLAELSEEGYQVSPESLKTFQGLHFVSKGSVMEAIARNNTSPTYKLEEYSQFVHAGGNIENLKKVCELGGTYTDYMEHRKPGNFDLYVKELEFEVKKGKAESAVQERKNKKESYKQDMEEALAKVREIAEKHKATLGSDDTKEGVPEGNKSNVQKSGKPKIEVTRTN